VANPLVEESWLDPPVILTYSPTNKANDTPDAPLNFTVNEPVSQITYSLDGQENVTVAQNFTLTGLSSGDYNVTFYATDNAGNIGASETIAFTIAEPQHEPFPTTLIVASVVTVAGIGVALIVYFKKRNR
jgi:hypothetical protein